MHLDVIDKLVSKYTMFHFSIQRAYVHMSQYKDVLLQGHYEVAIDSTK